MPGEKQRAKSAEHLHTATECRKPGADARRRPPERHQAKAVSSLENQISNSIQRASREQGNRREPFEHIEGPEPDQEAGT